MELKHFVRLLVALLVVPAAIALLLREPDASAITRPAPQPPVIKTEAEINFPADTRTLSVVVADQPVPLSEWEPGADLSAEPVEDLSAESLAALREALLEGAVTMDDLARDHPDALAALQQHGELDIAAELRQRLARLDGHRAAAVPGCQTPRRAYGRTI